MLATAWIVSNWEGRQSCAFTPAIQELRHILCATPSHSYPNAAHQTYCYYTPYSSYCFGCVGLHHARFTILNKRYSETEYVALVAKIIGHMNETGEWGEYFPAHSLAISLQYLNGAGVHAA